VIRVRVDDYPQTKAESQHTQAAFREFHRELSALLGVKRYLLGVIPCRCTAEDLLFLQRETDCVVGMHGIDHDEARLDRNGGNQFEHYLSTRQIAGQLEEHRLALEAVINRPVRVYMPPRNVIDWRTANLLDEVGFRWFTSGPETDVNVRDFLSGMCVHSQPPYEYGRTDELLQREAHLRIMEKSDRGLDVVLTLHWTWETNIGLRHMRSFLSQIPQRYFEDFDA
jgi:hypothetical protein